MRMATKPQTHRVEGMIEMTNETEKQKNAIEIFQDMLLALTSEAEHELGLTDQQVIDAMIEHIYYNGNGGCSHG